MSKNREDPRPLGNPASWARTPETFIAAQAHIAGVDVVAVAMERRWGVGRLRLLVPVELREKFDRQRLKLNAAVWHGDLGALQVEAGRMVKAWRVLDEAAVAACASFLSPEVWEATLEDGTVVALVRTPEEAHAVAGDGRQRAVYTVAEIAHMLSVYQEVTKVKDVIPGATVEHVRRTMDDPLDGIRDATGLDDPIDDVLLFEAG